MALKSRKKAKKKFSGPDKRRQADSPINEQLAARMRETVLGMMPGDRTAAAALEVAFTAMAWSDRLVGHFESENVLPRPIACQPGCHFCCSHQAEVTPLEALLIGHYLDRNFSAAEKNRVQEGIARAVSLKTGKSKAEIARIRRELPCPLLHEGRCSVYPVRPLVCRAMHSLAAEQCEAAFRSQALMSVPHYAHRHEIILSISRGLKDGCRALGCQSGSLDLARALHDFFHQETPVESWLRGERVFQI